MKRGPGLERAQSSGDDKSMKMLLPDEIRLPDPTEINSHCDIDQGLDGRFIHECHAATGLPI